MCPAAAAAAAAIVLGPVAHAPSRQDGAARDSAAQGPRAGRGSARRGAARAGRDRDGPCPGHDPSSLRRAGSPARSFRVGPLRQLAPAIWGADRHCSGGVRANSASESAGTRPSGLSAPPCREYLSPPPPPSLSFSLSLSLSQASSLSESWVLTGRISASREHPRRSPSFPARRGRRAAGERIGWAGRFTAGPGAGRPSPPRLPGSGAP